MCNVFLVPNTRHSSTQNSYEVKSLFKRKLIWSLWQPHSLFSVNPVQNLQLQWHWRMIWNKRLAHSEIRDETSDRRPEHSHTHTLLAAATHTHTQKGLELFKIRFPFLIQAVQCEYTVSIVLWY